MTSYIVDEKDEGKLASKVRDSLPARVCGFRKFSSFLFTKQSES